MCLFLVTLSSCGWQLRGTDNLSASSMDLSTGLSINEKRQIAVNPVYTQSQREFRKIFNRLLSSNEIEDSEDANISLAFDKEKVSRRAQAYGSTGIPAQYLLTMTLGFSLIDKSNAENTIQREVITRRAYDFDAELVGAKDREQQSLLNDMREDLAQQVFRILVQSQR